MSDNSVFALLSNLRAYYQNTLVYLRHRNFDIRFSYENRKLDFVLLMYPLIIRRNMCLLRLRKQLSQLLP